MGIQHAVSVHAATVVMVVVLVRTMNMNKM